MLTDLHVLESGDMILLDVPANLVDETLQRLDQFLFSEDVQLASLETSLRSVWLHGPRAATCIERATSGLTKLDDWPLYRNARGTFNGTPVVAARIDQLGVPGFVLFVGPADLDALTHALMDAGAVVAGVDAIEAARIENATPVFGIDMNTDTIPLEAGIESSAISFTKGCYVGQEIIIRVMHRGHGRVAKKLVTLRIEGDPPAAGAQISADAKALGHITSSARSPRGGAIALGYVHRDYLAPGTQVMVTDGEVAAPAVIGARPLTAAS
jgi:folate-binding protein YgfZ